MNGTCTQEAYQRYSESASKYSTPLTFDQWCDKLTNGVFDIMGGC